HHRRRHRVRHLDPRSAQHHVLPQPGRTPRDPCRPRRVLAGLRAPRRLRLRRDHRDHGLSHRGDLHRPVPQRDGLVHQRGQQPDRPKHCVPGVSAQGDERRRDHLAAGGTHLPGLDLLRVPAAHQRGGVPAAGTVRRACAIGRGTALPRRSTTVGIRAGVKAVDSRLLRHARAARGYVIFTVVLGLAVTALVLAQAGLLAHALATKALDALDPYFARYLPQLVLAVVVPVAVLARVAAADWISAVVIAVTLPLIPVFAVLVGLHTRARTQRQWRLLAALGGHFLDVVEGLPTLKLFGRAKAQAQVIQNVSEAHRKATMGTLRVAFLSALVLELAAALATALVAVEVGLRLLAGHLGYQTALLVLLLTPEAYLPLRAVGLHFHSSMEGAAAAGRVCDIIESAPASPGGAARGAGGAATPDLQCDLRYDDIILDAVSLAYPGRDRPALAEVSLRIRPGDRVAIM